MEGVKVSELEFDVSELSDAELAQNLRKLGANIGPITNSTRAVYQHKLQRWLKYGPSGNASLDETRLDVSHTQHGSMLDDQMNYEPIVQPDELAANDTENEDMEGIMARELQSAAHSTVFSQSTPFKDVTRELPNEEPALRSRSSVLNVTPRPSLHNYREDAGKRTAGEYAAGVRAVPGSFSYPNRSSMKNELQSSNKGYSATFWLAVAVFVVALLIVAVIFNMEPAYLRLLT